MLIDRNLITCHCNGILHDLHLQELRYFGKPKAIHKVGSILAVLVEHDHIADTQRMTTEICRVTKIEFFVDAVQRFFGIKGRIVNQIVILTVYLFPLFL